MHGHKLDTAGWGSVLLGNLLLQLPSVIGPTLGVISVAFGMWVQWQTYQLKKRESELKPCPRPANRTCPRCTAPAS